MKLITNLAVVCILCSLFVCGGATAAGAAESLCDSGSPAYTSFDQLRVFMNANLCFGDRLLLGGVTVIDCNGVKYTEFLQDKYLGLESLAKIDLSNSGLKLTRMPKEVKLHFILDRCLDAESGKYRRDLFTLSVAKYAALVVEYKEGHQRNYIYVNMSAFSLHFYEIGTSDAGFFVYDYSDNGEEKEIKRFYMTKETGEYGEWDV